MIYIVGGAPVRTEWLKSLQQTEKATWIGVDNGALSIIKAELTLDRAFGDFDSVSEKEFELISEKAQYIEKVKAEKNETDLELALFWALKQREPIRLVGATGGRLDHFLGNIQLLTSEETGNHPYEVELQDEQNLLRILKAGEWEIADDPFYTYLSVLPFTPVVEGLTLKGVKYPLTDHYLKIGTTLTISNEIIEPFASISFRFGIIMMVRSKDKE
ncbi:thiamine diphosphokinase [Jeotgalibacillus proteolyticus]|uniref:Thiamine diphosphokinase n=1 Tax=Jeotgalibacillus proteolyticus TaxID=2082395 RepID=A0A2S5GGI8_9BACL|nr:thiamine diphosphokinase [Jeotgalibacillus proteolyticus]PPA72096.1 thiamine diphosphokinase [Jeotgalibacillus proteolyticus]